MSTTITVVQTCIGQRGTKRSTNIRTKQNQTKTYPDLPQAISGDVTDHMSYLNTWTDDEIAPDEQPLSNAQQIQIKQLPYCAKIEVRPTLSSSSLHGRLKFILNSSLALSIVLEECMMNSVQES